MQPSRVPRWGVLVVVMLMLASPFPVWAKTPQETAQALLKQGRELLKKGDYSQAVIVLMKAQGTFPGAPIRLEIAAAYEGLGSLVDAAQLYEELQGDEGLFGKDKERCVKRLEELRLKLARLTIKCRVKDAEVTVNGTQVGTTPLTYPVYVEPGDITVSVKTPAKEVKQEHTLSAGDHKELSISLREQPKPQAPVTDSTLPPPSAALPPPSSPTAQATPTVRKPQPPPAPRRDAPRGGWLLGRRWTWVAAAGTVVIAAVGMSVGISAHTDYGEYKDDETSSSRYPELEDRISVKATAANVMFGVAGAAAVATVVLYFVEGRSVRQAKSSGRRWATAGPVARGSGGQLTVGTTF